MPFYICIILGILCLLPACIFTSKKAGFLVVNVLSENLYDDCHIKGSINVPFQEIDSFFNQLDPDAHVVFYCSNYMCTSSGYAAKKLKELRLSRAHQAEKEGNMSEARLWQDRANNVWAYEGGTAEWYQLKLPVEGGCAQAYLEKYLSPVLHDDDIPVITAQELAKKMGFIKEA